MKKRFVAVLMGSDSDLATVQHTLDTLDKLEIPWEVRITSAHRTPGDTRQFVQEVAVSVVVQADLLAGTRPDR